ncbi:MAG TPA: hypothetical protein VL492_08170 [Methylovirgula sp.]|nr:hypothetical protein [Methylovirgula sp.]
MTAFTGAAGFATGLTAVVVFLAGAAARATLFAGFGAAFAAGRADVVFSLTTFAFAEAVALVSRARAVLLTGVRLRAVDFVVALVLEAGLAVVFAAAGLRALAGLVFAGVLATAVFGRAALPRAVKRAFLVFVSVVRLLARLRASALVADALDLAVLATFLTEDIRGALLFGPALETEPLVAAKYVSPQDKRVYPYRRVRIQLASDEDRPITVGARPRTAAAWKEGTARQPLRAVAGSDDRNLAVS